MTLRKEFIRFLLVLAFSLILFSTNAQSKTEENKIKHFTFGYGAAAGFNINIPGNWKKLEKTESTILGYGGQLGGFLSFYLNDKWNFEPMIMAGYDNIPINSVNSSLKFGQLRRWSFYIPLTAGYLFNISEDMKAGPMTGIDLCYTFNDNFHSSSPNLNNDIKWNPFNLSWGFGWGMKIGNYAIDIMGWFGTHKLMDSHSYALPSHYYPNSVSIILKYYL